MSTWSPGQALASSDLHSEVATALRDFYSFLARLPWLEPSDILEPPPQGWPSINSDNFAPLHKSSAVIDLLKHIPYLRMDGSFERYTLIDCWEIPDTSQRENNFPDWVVALTYGKVHGQYIMLDTTDGTALSYSVQALHDPVYEADDPRAWRNECANPGSMARLSDILNEWKHDYEQLNLIGQTNGNGPLHEESSGDAYKKVRALMLAHGWPNTFDRENCRKAMLEQDQERSK
ncbi:hypothetical protein BKA63DRAFT_545167 [Paraphoma chrysanthemicola]|nr:hypothetical protein BKA63DRAFT_545167 [Paraphoma chrysanthemicola]